MNVTFERRLRTKPVKSRLGTTKERKVAVNNDLRQKLGSKLRTLDARSVLKNRRRRFALRRNAVAAAQRVPRQRRMNTNRVPFLLPLRTMRNDPRIAPSRSYIGSNRRLPIRRYSATQVPDLFNIRAVPPHFPLHNTSGRMFTHPQNHVDTVVTLSSGGTKLSPIQGFRLEVRNLQPSVTLDDVFELFSSIGALRLCNLVRPGQAEVVFNELADAEEAIRRYNNRELDGRPMSVVLVTHVPDDNRSGPIRLASRLGPRIGNNWQSSTKALTTSTLGKKTNTAMEVDMDVVRKALFNVSSDLASRKPVDFNVSLR